MPAACGCFRRVREQATRASPDSYGYPHTATSWLRDRQKCLSYGNCLATPGRWRYLEPSFSAASFWAEARASAAGTFTSGSTPVPSQLVLEMGFMARAKG